MKNKLCLVGLWLRKDIDESMAELAGARQACSGLLEKGVDLGKSLLGFNSARAISPLDSFPFPCLSPEPLARCKESGSIKPIYFSIYLIN